MVRPGAVARSAELGGGGGTLSTWQRRRRLRATNRPSCGDWWWRRGNVSSYRTICYPLRSGSRRSSCDPDSDGFEPGPGKGTGDIARALVEREDSAADERDGGIRFSAGPQADRAASVAWPTTGTLLPSENCKVPVSMAPSSPTAIERVPWKDWPAVGPSSTVALICKVHWSPPPNWATDSRPQGAALVPDTEDSNGRAGMLGHRNRGSWSNVRQTSNELFASH